MSNLSLVAFQAYVRSKDNHPHLKLEYLQKLIEEVGELAKAMRKNIRHTQTQDIKGTLEEELYDVLYYIVALSNVYEVDLESVMQLKEPISAAKYGQLEQLESFPIKVITLCGSVKFQKQFQEWNEKLTLAGNVVISLEGFHLKPTPEEKLILDQIHRRKIDLADEIFVIDFDGYIGESTRLEIDYATRMGKSVRYLSES